MNNNRNYQKTTEEIISEIDATVRKGFQIVACEWTYMGYARGRVSAAFRMARKRGIIVEDCKSVAGNPIYRMGLRVAS